MSRPRSYNASQMKVPRRRLLQKWVSLRMAWLIGGSATLGRLRISLILALLATARNPSLM
eukprot:8447783-Lingulodinium_polyedra.AAC.1